MYGIQKGLAEFTLTHEYWLLIGCDYRTIEDFLFSSVNSVFSKFSTMYLYHFYNQKDKNIKYLFECIDPEYSLILGSMRGKVNVKGKTIKEVRSPAGLALVM